MHFYPRHILLLLLQKFQTIDLAIGKQKKPKLKQLEYFDQKNNQSQSSSPDISLYQP